MQNQVPNKTDQSVNDFFHSKTFRTVLTIVLCVVGIPTLLFCGITILMAIITGGTILATIAAIVGFILALIQGFTQNTIYYR